MQLGGLISRGISKLHNQQMIHRIKKQSEEIQNITFKNIQYNAFDFLTENVLYSMMKSGELEERKVAFEKILLCKYTEIE